MAINEETIVRVLLRDQPKVLAYIQSIVQDEHLTDDIFQELSLYALSKRDEINDETHFVKWLRCVARNKSIDVLRFKVRTPLIFDDVLMDKLEADWQHLDEVPCEHMMKALRRCLGKLSPYGNRLIELRYREELTGRRLAEVLDRSVKTVSVALSRVHRALGNCIRAEMSGNGGKHV